MNVYGELIRGQLHLSASDLANPTQGLIYFNTGTLFPKVYNGSAWKTLVQTDSSQTLTNKDIDGGTASNTTRITVPKDTKTNLDALTRKEGTVVYASDTKIFYGDDGTQLNGFGAGSVPQATDTVQGTVTSYAPIVKSSTKTVTNANYTALDNDGYNTYLFSTGASNRTFTPPSAANNQGRRIKISKSDSGAGSLNVTGTLQGTTNPYISSQYGVIEMESDGTNWYLVNLKDSGSFTANLVGVSGSVTSTWYYSRSMNHVVLYIRGNTGGPNSDFYIAFTKSGNGTITINLPNSILCSVDQVWASKMVISYNDSGTPVTFIPADCYVNAANLVVYRDIGADVYGDTTKNHFVANQISWVIR